MQHICIIKYMHMYINNNINILHHISKEKAKEIPNRTLRFPMHPPIHEFWDPYTGNLRAPMPRFPQIASDKEGNEAHYDSSIKALLKP